jgi:hypothetical protein
MREAVLTRRKTWAFFHEEPAGFAARKIAGRQSGFPGGRQQA